MDDRWFSSGIHQISQNHARVFFFYTGLVSILRGALQRSWPGELLCGMGEWQCARIIVTSHGLAEGLGLWGVGYHPQTDKIWGIQIIRAQTFLFWVGFCCVTQLCDTAV